MRNHPTLNRDKQATFTAHRLAGARSQGSYCQELPNKHRGLRSHSRPATLHIPQRHVANYTLSRGARVTNTNLAAPPPDNQQAPKSPQGTIPNPFTFSLSQVKPTQLSGGTVKIVDSTTFTAATAISASEITVEPGAMR